MASVADPRVKDLAIGGVRVPAALVRETWPDPYMDIEDYDPESDLMSLNMGPQHPSTHGVLRVKLFLDGEICVKCVPYLGYLHRGVEKLCEKLTYVQVPSVVDKNDYVSPMMNELAVCMSFEKLLGIEVPERALVMRTVIAELQRLSSHLLWVGTWGLDMGGAIGGGGSLFIHTFRERELFLDLFEELTGGRFHYNHHTPGGQRHDIPPGWEAQVHQVLNVLESRLIEYEDLCTDNHIFQARTVGVGVIDPVLAMELGVSGPVARASGIDHDLRRDAPYAAYDRVKVQVPVRQEGDCFARYMVRLAEMRESIRIVRCLIDDIPEGPICGAKMVKLPGSQKVKAKEFVYAYSAIESPRGELGTWVVGQPKSASAYRCKIRPPSYHLVSMLPYLCVGQMISDIVVVLGSLDPILGEVDR